MAADRELAFAKVNLCLFVGPVRADRRHELVTIFESVSLADELVIEAGASERDEVVCDGVSGPNLVADALAALRAAGWEAPPVRVLIDKRIPVAAGMGGGSADAAALLRRAADWGVVAPDAVREIAVSLGADVPSQLVPGSALGTGAGEVLAPVAVADHGLLVLPAQFALPTAAVYREADRLGGLRSAAELAALRSGLVAAAGAPLSADLMVNDLQPAALSLAPQIGAALDGARQAGADAALVCGSGPTVIGVFWGADGADRAAAAAEGLRERWPGVVAVEPIR